MAYVRQDWDKLCAITSEICAEHRAVGDWIGRPAALRIACERNPQLSCDPPGSVDIPGKKSTAQTPQSAGAPASDDTTVGHALPWGEVLRSVGAETKSHAGEQATPGKPQPWKTVFRELGVSVKGDDGPARG